MFCCDGVLKNFDLRWYPDAALTVVMAAKGYPGPTTKGSVIEGLEAAAEVERAVAAGAGFGRVRRLDVPAPMNLVLELRP